MNYTLPETRNDFVAMRLSGKLDQNDCGEYISILEERINRYGRISLFCDMADLDGWTPAGLWADTQFDIKHASDFKRIAFVAEKKWLDLVTQAMKPFTSAELRHFDLAERDEALQWAKT
ncbi:STAS/SEC14 domain-containing protein [Pelagicoccus sp. SDUM812002]|uniref:STAS/SEC14 domain-containing protein n=1 Tax=Pelagicoccus sp. SDUM812002 TaxID=3041266 RepID=UPI002810616B|nr:STAS/SEC14 domain-containing protein [Pelagicoccus sp. SDUM812002]MDQ8184128.1 STAS/SEC14 domain-containing protein [Pelagicoccus sp. SDUM812002]